MLSVYIWILLVSLPIILSTTISLLNTSCFFFHAYIIIPFYHTPPCFYTIVIFCLYLCILSMFLMKISTTKTFLQFFCCFVFFFIYFYFLCILMQFSCCRLFVVILVDLSTCSLIWLVLYGWYSDSVLFLENFLVNLSIRRKNMANLTSLIHASCKF